MSKLDNISKSIKSKMSLKSYNTVNPQSGIPPKSKKVKFSVYVPEETMKKLNILCSKKLLENGKFIMSDIVTEAIEMFYESKS